MVDAMSAILETTQAERLATGFVFTEGPLWHPDGFYYFVDVRASMLYRITPGRPHEVVREKTGGGNGTTFDLQGRLILCEGDNRRVTRRAADDRFEVLVDRFEGKRLNRPNDVVCKSDGSIYFTDPGLRVPIAEREVEHRAEQEERPERLEEQDGGGQELEEAGEAQEEGAGRALQLGGEQRVVQRRPVLPDPRLQLVQTGDAVRERDHDHRQLGVHQP